MRAGGVTPDLPGGLAEMVWYYASGDTTPRAAVVTAESSPTHRHLFVFPRWDGDYQAGLKPYPIAEIMTLGLEGWTPIGGPRR